MGKAASGVLCIPLFRLLFSRPDRTLLPPSTSSSFGECQVQGGGILLLVLGYSYHVIGIGENSPVMHILTFNRQSRRFLLHVV